MHDAMAPLRAEVMGQPEAERVEYALDLLAFYLDPIPDFFDGCRALRLNLSNAELRMLYALDARRGRLVSVNSLLAARCLDRPCDEWADAARVVTSVSVIRTRLRKLGLPVEIDTWRGVGYVLEAPEGFRFETAAADMTARRAAS